MAAFGKAFSREIGKNTGKWVSNKVFGDGHATPHRLIHVREREKARVEREKARVYKEQVRQREKDRKERERQIREKEKRIAEEEKQALIQANKEEVEEHNNYISVIQSVHKDYSKKVDWDEIENLPDPEYVKKPEELKKYFSAEVDREISEKENEARKQYSLSPLKHLFNDYENQKNEWLFKIVKSDVFPLVALLLFFLSAYPAFQLEGFIKVLLIVSFISLAAIIGVLHIAAKDYNKKVRLKEVTEGLRNKRTLMLNDYLKKQRDAHHKYLEELEESKSLRELAKGVKAKDQNFFVYAINLFKPFEDLMEYGSDISYGLDSNQLVIDFYPHSEEVIPSTIKKILKRGGELREDPMPVTRFNEIYQDYVCSCALRIGKEVFQLLPAEKVVVNARGSLLNSATGNHEDQVILSVIMDRNNIEKINFDLLDPSDSMTNFHHNMLFKKKTGFEGVEEISH